MASHTRRSALRLAAATAGASTLAWAGHGDTAGPRATPASPKPDFVTSSAQAAIDRGLAFLARSQRPGGGFDSAPPGPAAVGVAAIAGLALLAGGHHPGRGRYARAVSGLAGYLLAASDQTNGFLTASAPPRPAPEEWSQQAMYAHGFGCLFLGELCGTLPDPGRQRRVRAALERAADYTVRAQAGDGGWRYAPRPAYSDVSATVAHLMALRAARNAGVLVRREVIDAATQFLLSCQRPDGGFGYTSAPTEGSMFARSAAAVVGLNCAGVYAGPAVERGLQYLTHFRPGRPLTARELPPKYYHYAHYYAATAMWAAGGHYWAAWGPAARDELLPRSRDGVWECPAFGPVYATAMSLLVLQLSDNYLPILQA